MLPELQGMPLAPSTVVRLGLTTQCVHHHLRGAVIRSDLIQVSKVDCRGTIAAVESRFFAFLRQQDVVHTLRSTLIDANARNRSLAMQSHPFWHSGKGMPHPSPDTGGIWWEHATSLARYSHL